jgi:hypothetical protein
MTKEKQRLMKFREMYKQKEKMNRASHASVASNPAIIEEAPLAEESATAGASKEEDKPAEMEETGETSNAKVEAESESLPAKEKANGHSIPTEAPNDVLLQPQELPPAAAELPLMEQDPGPPSRQTTGDHGKSDSGVAIEPESDPHSAPVSFPKTAEQVDAEPPAPKLVNVKTKSVEPEEHSTLTPTADEHHTIADTSSPVSALDSYGPASTRATSLSEISEKVDAESQSEVSSGHVVEGDSPDTVKPSQEIAQDDSLVDDEQIPTPKAIVAQGTRTPTSDTEDFRDDNSSTPIANLSSLHDHTTFKTEEPAVNKAKDLAVPEPLAAPTSTSSVSYDDELMDELRQAEVQEARPVSVSKSPGPAFFPSHPAVGPLRMISTPPRNIYSPERSTVNTGSASSSPVARFRSASGSATPSMSTPPHNASDAVTVAKTRIGGGIAAKIADLQRSFSRNSSAGSAPPQPSRSVSQRANAFQGSPSTTSQASSSFPTRKSSFFAAGSSGEDTPKQQSSSPVPQSLSTPSVSNKRSSFIFGGRSTTSPSINTQKSEAISVRATIVRPETKFAQPESLAHNEDTSIELHSSPIVMTRHQRARSSITSPRQLFQHSARSASVSSFRSTPASPLSSPDPAVGSSRPSTDSGFRRALGSISRRKSESKFVKSPTLPQERGLLPRSMSNSSLETAGSGDSNKAESHKKPSRTSRLLKRMSSSISSMAAGPRMQLGTLNERAGNEEEDGLGIDLRPKGVGVGDLNVQFPDTLVS